MPLRRRRLKRTLKSDTTRNVAAGYAMAIPHAEGIKKVAKTAI